MVAQTADLWVDHLAAAKEHHSVVPTVAMTVDQTELWMACQTAGQRAHTKVEQKVDSTAELSAEQMVGHLVGEMALLMACLMALLMAASKVVLSADHWVVKKADLRADQMVD